MTLGIRISRSGPNPFQRFQWTRAAMSWADATGPVVRSALKAAAPVAPVDGGRLRDSIRYARRTRLGRVTLEFSASAPYTRFVLDGTPPHIIRARTSRYLHWADTAGQNRFAKQVNHPGTKPNPFPRRALTPLMPAIQSAFQESVLDSMRR